GNRDEEAWTSSSTTFIGAYSRAEVRISTAWDEEHLYVFASVEDSSRNELPGLPIEEKDGISVMLAPKPLGDDDIVSGTYNIMASREGQTAAFRGSNGNWVNHQMNEVNVGIESSSQGYRLEMAIPWSAIGGRPEEEKGWGINFGLR